MEQNKIRSYILYAAGEIILVMIGILLALQVNNWNENKKDAYLTETYLEALREDLLLDIEKLEFQIDDLSFQLSQIDSLQNIMSQPTFTNNDFNDLIKSNLDIIQTLEDANLNNNTFLTLQNSGRVDLLDEEILFRLIDLNSLQKVFQFMISDNLDLKYSISDDFIKEVPFYYADMKVDINPIIEDNMWKSVDWKTARKKYYTLLNTMKVVNEVGVEITEDLKIETENLLTLLNN